MKIVGVRIPPPAPARRRLAPMTRECEQSAMNVTETSAEGLKRELKITVPANEVEDQITRRLGEIGRSVRIPGFRPGKVPLPLLRQRYGPAVRGEVLESTVQDSSAEAMREHNLRPALPPRVEIVSAAEGADLEYTMSVELLPEMPEPDFAIARPGKAGRRRAGGGCRPGGRTHRRSAAQIRAGRAAGRSGRYSRRRCRRPRRRQRKSPAAAAKAARSSSAPRGCFPASPSSWSASAPAKRARCASPFPRITATPIWPARKARSRSPSRRCAIACRRPSMTSWPRRSGSRRSPSCARRSASACSATTPRLPASG